MSFPRTRITLVQRLADGGSAADWSEFLADYWGPVCRFALRFGARSLDDAEDVASITFETLWRNRLLVRWVENPAAKLRSLLCGVVRKTLANSQRKRVNRERVLHELADWVRQVRPVSDAQVDAFYASWVEDVAGQAVQSLSTDYYRQGRGDYVRVLYGRLCQGMTIAEVAAALAISTSAVDNYYRHAKKQLALMLEKLVRRQVLRYCAAEEADQEFDLEWNRFGRHLAEFGGLEEAVRRAFELLDPVAEATQQRSGAPQAFSRLTSMIRQEVNRPAS